MIILYTTNCPKCQVLETKLNAKHIDYEKFTDVQAMLKKKIVSAPMLEVDGKLMEFGEAVKWVNEYEY